MPKRQRVTFKELIHRLRGFSTPFFGVSWEPPEREREVVRRLLNFLEDRRVLFNPHTLEVEWQVVRSVTEIRQRLTRVLDELPEGSHAVPGVRAMRAACRRFLDEPHPEAPHLGTGMGIGRPIRRMFVIPRLPDGKQMPGRDRADEEQEPVGIVDETDREDAGTDHRWGHPHGNGFLIALGELRATFGTHLAFLPGHKLEHQLNKFMETENDVYMGLRTPEDAVESVDRWCAAHRLWPFWRLWRSRVLRRLARDFPEINRMI